ncbi:neutral/alkaline non-lysosomal ceramidase N-terminal domain-containing protein [Zavarzinella formosa]|uniref:neutral/alkaline non-lysosomal ceramidase N-terminal domain-containing protein n=1 Tax=Zavarzinella formosa TaxID=360055 RepID=UPI0003015EE3|nr:neutral/alkaline non-lysosomal ceramidase N-terminal domain-containing protein [Zavarzinella formosa]
MNLTLKHGRMAGCGLLLLLIFTPLAHSAEAIYKAGIAKKVITPSGPLWMAGYGSRNKPCVDKQHDLWIKALALEDSTGHRFVILTSDLCGIPRNLSEPVCRDVMKATGLKRADILMNCSHTHCGPVVAGNLTDMYPMNAEQLEDVRKYTETLTAGMTEILIAALKDLKPANVSIGEGTTRFAVNRREVTPAGVINGKNPTGPVDHSVPVLKVTDMDGKVTALLFGYACHNTTMSYYKWSGDYAGFAQIELEKAYPGSTAMFWIGCGGDANPLPRSMIELCEKYGKELALAVKDVANGKMAPLIKPITSSYSEVTLPLDKLPAREYWEAEVSSKSIANAKRAERMLAKLRAGVPIPTEYPHYPIQIWKFGDQLTWVALGGEVVIDYNLRLKKELPANGMKWIAGYSNDVIAYIPSARVLKEGGYEADSSQVYYGLPTKWAPAIEDIIVNKTLELAK